MRSLHAGQHFWLHGHNIFIHHDLLLVWKVDIDLTLVLFALLHIHLPPLMPLMPPIEPLAYPPTSPARKKVPDKSRNF